MINTNSISEKKIYRIVSSLVAILFFFFFASVIFSPAIKGKTIYLYWFIPFFDVRFVQFLVQWCWKKININWIIVFLLICFFTLASGNWFMIVKLLSIFLCVQYLQYAYENELFHYFYYGLNINVFVGIIQFIVYYVDREHVDLVGPKYLANLIWGEYATDSFSNIFPAVSQLVRVCGWTREAGFFASYIIVGFIYYCFFDKRKSFFQTIIFIVAFGITFSKMSILVVPIILIVLFKDYINRIPLILGAIIVSVALSIGSFLLNRLGFYTPHNESIAQRLIWYSAMWYLPLKNLLFGYDDVHKFIDELSINFPIMEYLFSKNYQDASGYAAIVQKFGLVGLGMTNIMVWLLKCKTASLWFFLIATMNVEPFSSTSFVVLAYWIAKQMNNDRKKEVIK